MQGQKSLIYRTAIELITSCQTLITKIYQKSFVFFQLNVYSTVHEKNEGVFVFLHISVQNRKFSKGYQKFIFGFHTLLSLPLSHTKVFAGFY